MPGSADGTTAKENYNYAYDNLGRRTAVARAGGSGVSTSYTYDGMSRLASFTHNASGTAQDLTVSFGYNPASQIVSRTVSNAAYKWAVAADLTTNYTSNSLNQIATLAGSSFGHDARGNTDDDTVETYEFDADNRLIEAGTVTQGYDPLGRLYTVAASSTVKFLYDGADVIAEYDGSNNLLRRYVHGPGVDEPVVWLEGTGTSNRTWLMADERGSVVAHANASAAVSTINVYDPYGMPGSGNAGRFQYTGQMWSPETGLYHYKARAYSPATGRFMQPDPIGYAGGMNLYAYVGNDPVNWKDPSGLKAGEFEDRIVVTAIRKTWYSIESIKPNSWGIDYSIVNLMLNDIRQGGSLAPGGAAAGTDKDSNKQEPCTDKQKYIRNTLVNNKDVAKLVDKAVEITTKEQFRNGQSGRNLPEDQRYVLTGLLGPIDLVHVVSAGNNRFSSVGGGALAGLYVEFGQWRRGESSAFLLEDIFGNSIGQNAKTSSMLDPFRSFGDHVQIHIELLNPVNPEDVPECK